MLHCGPVHDISVTSISKMAPWNLKQQPAWQAYNNLTVRPTWWPSFSTDANGRQIIATGELWCIARDADGAIYKSDKFSNTGNLRKHYADHHNRYSHAADGPVRYRYRAKLIRHFRTLITAPTLDGIHTFHTFDTPAKTKKTTPVPAPQPSQPAPALPPPPVAQCLKIYKSEARQTAGFIFGCEE